MTTSPPTGPTGPSRPTQELPLPDAAPPRAGGVTWAGVRTIALLELRQRVRSTRWKVALVAWFGLVGAVSVLLVSVFTEDAVTSDGGAWVYGFTLVFVLGLGLVVSPTLSSTAINGDRNAGTLAILQVTLLSPAEIALGKLLAGWAAALVFLVISTPFLLWGALLGGTDVVGFLVGLVVLALLLGVVCAIGLGFSSLTTRTAGSSVLTYVVVMTLTVLTLVVFALSTTLVTQQEQVQVLTVPADANGTCVWVTEERTRTHTERTWWLLAVNPFVVLADSATPAGSWDESGDGLGPLQGIRQGMRELRQGETGPVDECWSESYGPGGPPVQQEPSTTPIWPAGLAANLALGAGAMVVAIRRLAVPYRTLAPGTRVA